MLDRLRKFLSDLMGWEYIKISLRVNSDGDGEMLVDYNQVFVSRVRENYGLTGTSKEVIDQFVSQMYYDIAVSDPGDDDIEDPDDSPLGFLEDA